MVVLEQRSLVLDLHSCNSTEELHRLDRKVLLVVKAELVEMELCN